MLPVLKGPCGHQCRGLCTKKKMPSHVWVCLVETELKVKGIARGMIDGMGDTLFWASKGSHTM